MAFEKKTLRGIMFHYFHDNKFFKKSPGSITAKDFNKIIKKIGKKNILNPTEFIKAVINKKIKPYHTCFTFDDALRCQYKIALPVLKINNIKSFFFITTSIFTRKPNLMEIFRFFRDNKFKNLKTYYLNFYRELKKQYPEKKLKLFLKKNNSKFKKKKKLYPFYSIQDIKFREVRDKLLKPREYERIMKSMFRKQNFNYKRKLKNYILIRKILKKYQMKDIF